MELVRKKLHPKNDKEEEYSLKQILCLPTGYHLLETYKLLLLIIILYRKVLYILEKQ